MSRINPTVPIFGTPTTLSVRENFAIARQEIEELEATKATREELRQYLPLAGGQMTGPLALAADPTTDLGAATRHYVDTEIEELYSSRVMGRFLPLDGGDMSGPLTLAANPTQPMQAATRDYVDTAPFLPIGGGELTGPLLLWGLPTSPQAAATRQYVDETVSGAIGLTEAPVDGRIYARGDRVWHLFGAVPVGGMLDWPSRRIPARWLLCDGRAVPRGMYSVLFGAIGTDWGDGDGETTFNLPDFRGRSAIGLDADNGEREEGQEEGEGVGYAHRVTAAISGIDATQVGAVGGDQRLQAHNHHLNDPTHNHDPADPGHSHHIHDPAHSHLGANHHHHFHDPSHSHGVIDHAHGHTLDLRVLANSGALANNGTAVTFHGGHDVGAHAAHANIPGTHGAHTGGQVHDGGQVQGHAAHIGCWLDHVGTGIGIHPRGTGIWIDPSGNGGSNNMPPVAVCPKIIYAGV